MQNIRDIEWQDAEHSKVGFYHDNGYTSVNSKHRLWEEVMAEIANGQPVAEYVEPE